MAQVAVHLTGWLPCLCFLLPLHSLSFSVVELQQLAEGHQEPYLLRWDQSQSKCSPASGSPPGVGCRSSSSSPAALHSLESAWSPAASS